MTRRPCSTSEEDLGFFFDPHHAPLAATARALATHWESGAPHDARDVAASLAGRGLLAACVERAYGGLEDGPETGLDVRAVCLVREALGWCDGLADTVFAMQGLGSYPITLAGTEVQKSRWLPGVRSGERLAAFAITEHEAGSDVAAMSTTARLDGDAWVLDGRKTFISNAGVAGLYVVFANADIAKGRKGITAFIVSPEDPGFVFEESLPVMADHPLGTIRFDGCRVPLDRLLGAVGDGFRIAMSTLDVFRSTVGAAALGMARRALDEALERTATRRQFGKSLAEFQTVQGYLADMATELDAARLLVYRAAHAKDRGAPRVTLEASMGKMFATEAAQRIIDRALQLHGGAGLLRGSVVERLYREVRALRIYEGTTEIQRLVIASQLR
ncbi:MAG: acyl-CoA dehydrogenase family protein [Polyangiales bacterium]